MRRAEKVARVADFIPPQGVELGDESGPIAVVGWGSTYGPIWRAVQEARAEGVNAAHIHLRWLNPLPANLGDLLRAYDRILLPEMNMGQCASLLRDKLEIKIDSLTKVSGQPFKIAEILEAIRGGRPFADAAE